MEWNVELGGAEAAALALAVISGTLLIALIILWSRQSRRGAPPAQTTDSAELHAAMVRLQDELPQLFRNMTGRLDAKMRALRELIQEAGATIDELRRSNAVNSAAPHTATAERRAAPPAEPADRESEQNNDHAPVVHVETQSKPAVPPKADLTELRSQRYAHVYSLADAGLDPTEISAETGMHRGEVELVLSLRRKRVRLDRADRPEPTRIPSSPEEATV